MRTRGVRTRRGEAPCDDYRSLYNEYRTESYYGDRQVREGEADAMFDLAVATHDILRDHPTEHDDCLCD